LKGFLSIAGSYGRTGWGWVDGYKSFTKLLKNVKLK